MTSTTGLRETLERARAGLRKYLATGNLKFSDDGSWETTLGLSHPQVVLTAVYDAMREVATLLPSPNGSGEQVSEASERADELWQKLLPLMQADSESVYANKVAALALIEAALSASVAGPVPEGFDREAFLMSDDSLPSRIAPAPALPEVKPVASPAEGEAVPVGYLRGSGVTMLAEGQVAALYPHRDYQASIPVYASPDREAATREAVIEECAKICDAVRPRLSAGRSRRLNQMDEHVASVADSLASRIRALAQQAKPQQEKP